MTTDSTKIFLINDDVKAIKAKYDPDHKTEIIKTFKTFNDKIEVDDYIIVPTDTRHGMTVCKVTEIDVEPDYHSDRDVKWVIGVIDRTHYEETLEKEKEAINVIKRAEKRRERDSLREAMMANHSEEIKKLEMAKTK